MFKIRNVLLVKHHIIQLFYPLLGGGGSKSILLFPFFQFCMYCVELEAELMPPKGLSIYYIIQSWGPGRPLNGRKVTIRPISNLELFLEKSILNSDCDFRYLYLYLLYLYLLLGNLCFCLGVLLGSFGRFERSFIHHVGCPS